MNDIKLIVTGGSGFVGSALLTAVKKAGYNATVLRRSKAENIPIFNNVQINTLDGDTDFTELLDGAANGVVIHTAARAHVMVDTASDPLALYRVVNVDGTLNLARQAAAAGIKRFIFISSVKVNGEQTEPGSTFTEKQLPQPEDAYGLSKAEAELGLKQIAASTGMELVIIRPPLVYGPGVKGNFAAMIKVTARNLPLPFGKVGNKRSLVALDNLIDLIMTCIEHPKAANQTFLVSDDNDVSTTELLKMMTRAAGKHPRLLPVPVSWLTLAGKLTGKKAVVDRLCSNLQVDITHTKETLNWKPPVSMEEGIKRCFVNEVIC